jgi:hypothetical protein
LEFLRKGLSLVFRPKHLDTQPQHMTVADQIRAGGSLSQLAAENHPARLLSGFAGSRRADVGGGDVCAVHRQQGD